MGNIPELRRSGARHSRRVAAFTQMQQGRNFSRRVAERWSELYGARVARSVDQGYCCVHASRADIRFALCSVRSLWYGSSDACSGPDFVPTSRNRHALDGRSRADCSRRARQQEAGRHLWHWSQELLCAPKIPFASRASLLTVT